MRDTPIIMNATSALTSTGNVLGNLLFFIFYNPQNEMFRLPETKCSAT